jgi:hypothetical protein
MQPAVSTVERTVQKKRFSVELSLNAYDELQALAKKAGKNMIEVIRLGIALYTIAVEEKDNGRKIAVVQGDKVIKEIVIP